MLNAPTAIMVQSKNQMLTDTWILVIQDLIKENMLVKHATLHLIEKMDSNSILKQIHTKEELHIIINNQLQNGYDTTTK